MWQFVENCKDVLTCAPCSPNPILSTASELLQVGSCVDVAPPKMFTPRTVRRFQILLGALSYFSLDTQGDHGQRFHQKVNGILGGSASFCACVYVTPGESMARTKWSFTKDGGTEKVLVATFENGETYQNFSDQFKGRLEVVNETVLRIRDLELEDSGKFTARVRRPSKEGSSLSQIEEYIFSLSISEPVPEPQITPQLISNTPEGCNVTLRCRTFGKGSLNVSWETGIPPRNLEGGSGWYRRSENGSELHVRWQPGSVASRFTCLAGRKKVSVDLQNICGKEDPNVVPWWVWLVGTLVLLLLAASLATWKCKRTPANTDVSSAAPQKERPSDPLYCEIPENESPPGCQPPGISAGREQRSPMNSQTVYTLAQGQIFLTNTPTVYTSLKKPNCWSQMDT